MNGEYTRINTFKYLFYFSNQSWSVFQVFFFSSVNILCEEATSIKEIKENDSY